MGLDLLVWSGGYDSTLLLLNAMKLGRPVDTIYFNYKNLGPKREAELIARKNILEYFLKNNIPTPRDYIIEIPTFPFSNINSDTASFIQQPYAWISGLLFFLVSEKEMFYKNIQFGFLNSYAANPVLDHFKQAYESIFKLSRVNRDFIPIPLSFPLITMSKSDVLHQYSILGHEDLLNLLWTCESPIKDKKSKKFKECKKCNTCINLKMAKYRISIDNNKYPKK